MVDNHSQDFINNIINSIKNKMEMEIEIPDEKKEDLFNYLNNNIFNDNEIEIRIKYENEKKKFYLIVLNKNSI